MSRLLRATPRCLAALCTCAPFAAAQSTLQVFPGDSSYDLFGASVSGVGDVDGDGIGDMVAGAPGDANNGNQVGYARVFSGASGSTLLTLFGLDADDRFGTAVGGAGDVNGDGRADLIVGSHGENSNGIDSGSARVFSGIDGSLLYHLTGVAGDHFGWAVSGAGDVNADGFGDFVVGAPYSDASGSQAGYVRVFDGSNGAILFTHFGTSNSAHLGESVCAVGDLDQDGFDDVMAGAPNEGSVAFGAGLVQVFSGASGAVLLSFSGSAMLDKLGHSVSAVSDLDGDGRPDLIIGVPGLDQNGLNCGGARVYSGASGLELYVVHGDDVLDRAGTSVAGCGDLSGDGVDDFVVGAPWDDNGFSSSGSARVYSGASGAELYTVDGGAITLRFGGSVADVGDVDQDGYADLLVGAIHDNPSGGLSGSARLISGVVLAAFESYCSATPNSTGNAASITASGSGSVLANDLVLHASQLPAQVPGLFIFGGVQIELPFGDGFRCVGGALFRLGPGMQSDASGNATRALDLSSPPASSGPGQVGPGDHWNFQYYYRDTAAGGAGFNLSDALEVTFAP